MNRRILITATLALLLLTACSPSDQKANPTAQYQTAVAIIATTTAQTRGIPPSIAIQTPGLSRTATSGSVEGGRIAFYSRAREGICIMNADGTGVTDRLTPIWSADPAWSPDGQQIAFTSGNNNEGYNVFVINVNGTNMRQLTQHGGVWELPVWSPDGTRIAFHAKSYDLGTIPSHRIGIVGVDGSDLTLVEPDWGEGECFPLDTPAWSPDGEQIAFGGYCRDRDEHGGRFGEEHMGIFIMSLDGSSVTQLIRLSAVSNMDLDWSPDGKRIAFSAYIAEMGGQQIYVVNADGTDLAQLTTNGGYYPSWSPDGKQIVYQTGHLSSPALYVINTDSRDTGHWVGAGSNPDWSP